MLRRHTLPVLALIAAATLRAQSSPWMDDRDPARPAPRPEAPKETAVLPLSPNLILGRVRSVGPSGLTVLILDRRPGDFRENLVARDADCTPRAVLIPVDIRRDSSVAVYRVAAGTVREGMEIILPSTADLKSAREKLSVTPTVKTAPAKP